MAPRLSEHRTVHDFALDLRRRRGEQVRAQTEAILERAVWLRPDDRIVIEAVFRHGMTLREVAALRGVPGAAGRTLGARVRRLVRRLSSPEFEVVRRYSRGWPPGPRRVARACVAQGLSLRAAAKALGLSIHGVREDWAAARALIHAAMDERSVTALRRGEPVAAGVRAAHLFDPAEDAGDSHGARIGHAA